MNAQSVQDSFKQKPIQVASPQQEISQSPSDLSSFGRNKLILFLGLLFVFLLIVTGDIITKKSTLLANTAPSPTNANNQQGYGSYSTPTPHITGSVYWGAFAYKNNHSQNSITLQQFEADAGKNVAIDHVGYIAWPSGFPSYRMSQARREGAIPMITWMSGSAKLSDIIAGKYDKYIISFARSVKKWKHPFFLRFDHEMNGNWYGWSEGVNGNTNGQYALMWQHVHTIFTNQGVVNATWVWCPSAVVNSVRGQSKFAITDQYPGNAYVDWVCMDGYNRYNGIGTAWTSFTDVFSQTYTQLTTSLAPSKPLMIGEFSSSEDAVVPTRKSSWFTDALTTQLPQNFPLIKAIVLFNIWHPQGKPFDWRIESSANAQAAFRAGIASPYYATNSFYSIDCSTGYCPIPPLK